MKELLAVDAKLKRSLTWQVLCTGNPRPQTRHCRHSQKYFLHIEASGCWSILIFPFCGLKWNRYGVCVLNFWQKTQELSHIVTHCLAIWQYILLEQLVHCRINVVCKCINIERMMPWNQQLWIELMYILHRKGSVNRMISVKLCCAESQKDFAHSSM